MKTIHTFIITLFITFVSTLSSAEKQSNEIFGDSFEKNTIDHYLEGHIPKTVSLELDNKFKMGKILVFKQGTTGGFRFKKVEIKPNKKYKLTFRGKVIGDDVIEKNSRINIMQLVSNNILWNWGIGFFDADKKSIPRPIQGPLLSLVSNQWKTYTSVFYTPPKAAYMQLEFSNGNPANGLELDDLQLGLCPNEGAINCNPDFRYGSYNYTGWKEIIEGGLLLNLKNNQHVLDTAYGSVGRRFPLSDKGTYRLYARGSGHGRNQVVILFLCDVKGQQLKYIILRGTPEGKYVDFVVPKGTASGYFRVYNYLLKEVRLTRIGDKSTLK